MASRSAAPVTEGQGTADKLIPRCVMDIHFRLDDEARAR
jgi:hypothetical protein